MNTYFGLSSTNNHVQQAYETDYHRGNFRLTTKDSSFLHPYSNLNMIHPGTSEQYPSTNDYLFPTSTFSMSVPNSMLYYTHPWLRPGINQ
jgi:archaellum component FlaF (FlaF/FlaG flagellin family)